ncbi:uncharacterized protein LOC115024717 isoform X2 [Cottoperca gobio]|nr:uncharacterized protein LOC115024717 isoform X2 [Cottoperca gobio]
MSLCRMRVNSSAEIRCSTSLSNPMGLTLQRSFHGKPDVVYLDLKNGTLIKNTTAQEFKGRIHVAADRHTEEGCGFILRLSLLGLEDTGLYFCSWSYMSHTVATRKNTQQWHRYYCGRRRSTGTMQRPRFEFHLDCLHCDSFRRHSVPLNWNMDPEMQTIYKELQTGQSCKTTQT